MLVAIAEAAAVNEHGLVEQAVVGLTHLLHPGQEPRELLNVEPVNLRELGQLRLVALMVGKLMVRLGHADFRKGAVAAVVRKHERADARRVALEGQQHEVEHRADVVAVGVGNTGGRREAGQLRRTAFGLLDAPLHFADGREVLVELLTIGGGEVAVE